ncbi:MAG: hypothetical protein MJA30_29880 [Cytophagales bacterium]|nr:hypothetical protein [Cytophagales bacterium]
MNLARIGIDLKILTFWKQDSAHGKSFQNTSKENDRTVPLKYRVFILKKLEVGSYFELLAPSCKY